MTLRPAWAALLALVLAACSPTPTPTPEPTVTPEPTATPRPTITPARQGSRDNPWRIHEPVTITYGPNGRDGAVTVDVLAIVAGDEVTDVLMQLDPDIGPPAAGQEYVMVKAQLGLSDPADEMLYRWLPGALGVAGADEIKVGSQKSVDLFKESAFNFDLRPGQEAIGWVLVQVPEAPRYSVVFSPESKDGGQWFAPEAPFGAPPVVVTTVPTASPATEIPAPTDAPIVPTSPPQPTAPLQPTAPPAPPTVPPVPRPDLDPDTDKNCSDFSSHREAQAWWNHWRGQGRGNPGGLDGDGDGNVCESR